jgi:hypothetical protein
VKRARRILMRMIGPTHEQLEISVLDVVQAEGRKFAQEPARSHRTGKVLDWADSESGHLDSKTILQCSHTSAASAFGVSTLRRDNACSGQVSHLPFHIALATSDHGRASGLARVALLFQPNLNPIPDRLNLLPFPLSPTDEIAKWKFRTSPRYNIRPAGGCLSLFRADY